MFLGLFWLSTLASLLVPEHQHIYSETALCQHNLFLEATPTNILFSLLLSAQYTFLH